jgi:hypothetical protein
MEMPRNTAAKIIVNWNRVFSNPRLVRTVEPPDPKSPALSLTCRRINRIIVMDIKI